MKYKDLNIGDWFTYDKMVWMKCQMPNGTPNNLCISGDNIGRITFAFRDDAEVNFCSQFWANTPFVEDDCGAYGLYELYDILYNVYAYVLETNSIIMKCFVDGIGKQMIISLNGDNAGHWCEVSINYFPLYLKNNFWMEFPENA